MAKIKLVYINRHHHEFIPGSGLHKQLATLKSHVQSNLVYLKFNTESGSEEPTKQNVNS